MLQVVDFVLRLARNDPTLTKLDLGYHRIEDAGAQAIGEALRQNTKLAELHLSNNSLEDAGAQAIGEGGKDGDESDYRR